MADRKIRWGIVSTADIGMKKVTPGIMNHHIPKSSPSPPGIWARPWLR